MEALTPSDEQYLRAAIDLSRHALEDQGKTPFGAILVLDGQAIGNGTSSVIELLDSSAHAEVMALRDAAKSARSAEVPEDINRNANRHRC
jgi:guanine deaminase